MYWEVASGQMLWRGDERVSWTQQQKEGEDGVFAYHLAECRGKWPLSVSVVKEPESPHLSFPDRATAAGKDGIPLLTICSGVSEPLLPNAARP